MDDELQQLEAELKRLQPVAPAPTLVDRVERELASTPARRRLTEVHWLWAALPAAAAVALVFVQFVHERPNASAVEPPRMAPPVAEVAGAPDPLKPVAAENVLVAAADEGLVILADGTPARRERLQFVDTITWRSPRTNASLTWRVPREEVRVVPVSFQ